ncbi:hypothetical protein [Microbacterium elymi]|uniref:Uncharacterized protein n=1 Tax=Microbacterium elymi TaxID=2909587 RepID=A0ABY5NL91_9MICO|nr:hypothetical protein [Microbacterium elymi]UUT35881.1 hypothetical protein L2X98_22245 [Microbacterium elymi]
MTATAASTDGSPNDPAVDAAYAQLDVTSTAQTHLSGTTRFQVAGALSLSATTTSNLTANGSALLAGAGAGVALLTLNQTTKAYIDANTTGNTAASLAVRADTDTTLTTHAAASPGGATANTDGAGAAITPAQFVGGTITALSPLTVAGALAVTRMTGDTEAYIAPSSGTFGLTTAPTGTVIVHADGGTSADTVADGHAMLRSGAAIAAAVAVAIATLTTTAAIRGTVDLQTGTVTVDAVQPVDPVTGVAPASAQTFDTRATSGGGAGIAVTNPVASPVSFQGSFAVNVVTVDHSAAIGAGARLSVHGADVTVASTHGTESTTSARPSGPFFDPTVAIEADHKTIDLPMPFLHSNGGLAGSPVLTGDKVVYTSGGGSDIGGLTGGGTYYVYCPGGIGFACTPDPITGITRVQADLGEPLPGRSPERLDRADPRPVGGQRHRPPADPGAEAHGCGRRRRGRVGEHRQRHRHRRDRRRGHPHRRARPDARRGIDRRHDGEVEGGLVGRHRVHPGRLGRHLERHHARRGRHRRRARAHRCVRRRGHPGRDDQHRSQRRHHLERGDRRVGRRQHRRPHGHRHHRAQASPRSDQPPSRPSARRRRRPPPGPAPAAPPTRTPRRPGRSTRRPTSSWAWPTGSPAATGPTRARMRPPPPPAPTGVRR